MDNFIDKLNSLEVEPRNSSWLKLENRLQDDRYYAKNKSNHRFKYSMIAASITLVLCASVLILNYFSDDLQSLDGFVVENIEKNIMNTNDIYNIDQLKELNLAYLSHTINPEQVY